MLLILTVHLTKSDQQYPYHPEHWDALKFPLQILSPSILSLSLLKKSQDMGKSQPNFLQEHNTYDLSSIFVPIKTFLALPLVFGFLLAFWTSELFPDSLIKLSLHQSMASLTFANSSYQSLPKASDLYISYSHSNDLTSLVP